MKGAIALVAIAAIGAAFYFSQTTPVVDEKLSNEFEEFLAKFGKSYDTIQEYEMRFKFFRDNLKTIAELMQSNSGATYGINQFADLSFDEFSVRFGFRPDLRDEPVKQTWTRKLAKHEKSVDWTHVMHAPKDQGACGSCWAFSATGTLEGNWALKTGEMTDMSEQELVDCCYIRECGCLGCLGGLMEKAFNWNIKHDGEAHTEDYPYSGIPFKSCRLKTEDIPHFEPIVRFE